MEAKWKLDWDYKGWVERNCATGPWSQNDWNQTLITRINQIAAQIYMATLIGAPNRIRMSSKVFKILKTTPYIQITDEAKVKLMRYDIEIDNTLTEDKLYIYSEPKYGDYVVAVKEDGDLEMFNQRTISLHQPSSPELEDLRREGAKIVTKDMLVGEITLLNYGPNPDTGKIIFDEKPTQLDEDYFLD